MTELAIIFVLCAAWIAAGASAHYVLCRHEGELGSAYFWCMAFPNFILGPFAFAITLHVMSIDAEIDGKRKRR